MHNDVTGCVTFISNKIEYLKKYDSKKILSKKLYYDFKSFQYNKKNCERKFLFINT